MVRRLVLLVVHMRWLLVVLLLMVILHVIVGAVVVKIYQLFLVLVVSMVLTVRNHLHFSLSWHRLILGLLVLGLLLGCWLVELSNVISEALLAHEACNYRQDDFNDDSSHCDAARR